MGQVNDYVFSPIPEESPSELTPSSPNRRQLQKTLKHQNAVIKESANSGDHVVESYISQQC